MQLLQPDVRVTCKLPSRPLEFYSRHSCFPSRNLFSARQLGSLSEINLATAANGNFGQTPSEPSVHNVMGIPDFPGVIRTQPSHVSIARGKEL